MGGDRISHERLTKREMEVMQLLWNADKPLMATDIQKVMDADAKDKKGVSIFLVQKLIKSLINKGYISVAEEIPIANTKARTFVATVSESGYAIIQYKGYFTGSNSEAATSLVANLLDSDEYASETIGELEKILAERKEQLKKKNESD